MSPGTTAGFPEYVYTLFISPSVFATTESDSFASVDGGLTFSSITKCNVEPSILVLIHII